MNVHHLELFYYVAKYEGITAAVRKMPYGIQQPALSGQLLQLEKNLGVKLFHRRPFALTPEGEKLYDFAYPFFSKIGEVEEELKSGEQKHLRIAASASVMRNHLPEVLEQFRDQEAAEGDLRISLKEIESQSEILRAVENQEADMAVMFLEGKLASGLKSMKLLELEQTLLVPKKWKAKKLDDLLEPDEWQKGKVGARPLLSLPPSEILRQLFEKDLEKRKIVWEPQMEVNSVDIIRDYAKRGFGAGVSAKIPGMESKEIEMLDLEGFAPLEVHAVTLGAPKLIVLKFLKVAQGYLTELLDEG